MRRIAVDPQLAYRFAVQPDRVIVVGHEKGRPASGEAVQVFGGRQISFWRIKPTFRLDPFQIGAALREVPDLVLNFLHFLQCDSASESQHVRVGTQANVEVAVDKARQHQSAAGVDDAGSSPQVGKGFIVTAYPENAVAFDRHRLAQGSEASTVYTRALRTSTSVRSG